MELAMILAGLAVLALVAVVVQNRPRSKGHESAEVDDWEVITKVDDRPKRSARSGKTFWDSFDGGGDGGGGD